MKIYPVLPIFLGLLLCFHTASAQNEANNHPEGNTMPAFSKGSVSLRTHVLPWTFLIANAGVEYKPTESVGLLVDGAFTHFDAGKNKLFWRLWHVSPQLRLYTGAQKAFYGGAAYIIGEYNYSGRQGNYQGGGLALGKQWYCNKNLLVDTGITLGYLHLYNREKYMSVENTYYRQESLKERNYWGPVGATIALVWKIN